MRRNTNRRHRPDRRADGLRRSSIARAFGAVAFVSALTLGPAGHAAEGREADPRILTLDYELELIGFDAAKATVQWRLDEAGYAIRFDMRPVGIVRLFSKWSLDLRSGGVLEAETIRPLAHRMERVRKGRLTTTEFDYGPEGAVAARIEPPPRYSDGDIDADRLVGAMDLLSAMVKLTVIADATGTCDHRVLGYEGRKLLDLLYTTEEDVPRRRVPRRFREDAELSCALSVGAVAGAFQEDEEDAGLTTHRSDPDAEPVRLILGRPVADGPLVPLQIDLPENFGGLFDLELAGASVATAEGSVAEALTLPTEAPAAGPGDR